MRKHLFVFALACVLGVVAFLLSQTPEVIAIGAASDNATMPNLTTDNQTYGAIEPPVEYVLRDSSSQPSSAPPRIITSFEGGVWDGEKYVITGDENWYLGVDINTPGWIYIYEYFPLGTGTEGRWITYKWELPQSGIWRLGPFAAEDNEPEGRHVYRVWFYNDGQWATGDVDWIYSRIQPAGQPGDRMPPQSPSVSARQSGFWLVLLVSILLVVALVTVSFYLFRFRPVWVRGKGAVSIYPDVEPGTLFVSSSSGITAARIVLPNGMEFRLGTDSRIMGRGDFARALTLDELSLISRRHFEIGTHDGQFFIKDLGSANGISLNGDDISGKGRVILNDNDVIEVADVIKLTFRLS